MSSWSYLPAEILDYIFRQDCLNRSNALQCSLVCKSWNRAANVKLYKEVNIRNHSKLAQFLKSVKSSQLGELVYTFKINPSSFRGNERGYVLLLGEVCPNIQKFDCTVRFPKVWNILKSDSLWKLNRLPRPYPEEKQDYYKCALRYRQTLTHLCLPRYFPTDPWLHWFLSYLNEFTQLSHLDIYTSYPELSLMDYDLVTQHARQLTSLKIVLRDPYGLTMPDLLCAEPRSGIRELNVEFKYYPGTVHYLIRKFPSLKSLTLAFRGQTAEVATELQACFLEIADSFVDYLRRIDYYNVTMACTQALLSAYFKCNPKSTLSLNASSYSIYCPPLVLEPDRVTIYCDPEQVKKWSSPHVLSISLSTLHGIGIKQWIQEIFTCFPRLKAFECSIYGNESQTVSFASGLSRSLQALTLHLMNTVQKIYIDSSRFSSLQYITLDITSVEQKLSFNLSGLSLQQLQLRLHQHTHSLQDDEEIYLQVETNEAGVKSFTFEQEGNSFKVIRGYASQLLSLRIDLGCFAIDCFSFSLDNIFKITRGYKSPLPSLRIDLSCFSIDCFSLSLVDIDRSNYQQWEYIPFRNCSLNF